jgi:hypothetical protein
MKKEMKKTTRLFFLEANISLKKTNKESSKHTNP